NPFSFKFAKTAIPAALSQENSGAAKKAEKRFAKVFCIIAFDITPPANKTGNLAYCISSFSHIRTSVCSTYFRQYFATYASGAPFLFRFAQIFSNQDRQQFVPFKTGLTFISSSQPN